MADYINYNENDDRVRPLPPALVPRSATDPMPGASRLPPLPATYDRMRIFSAFALAATPQPPPFLAQQQQPHFVLPEGLRCESPPPSPLPPFLMPPPPAILGAGPPRTTSLDRVPLPSERRPTTVLYSVSRRTSNATCASSTVSSNATTLVDSDISAAGTWKKLDSDLSIPEYDDLDSGGGAVSEVGSRRDHRPRPPHHMLKPFYTRSCQGRCLPCLNLSRAACCTLSLCMLLVLLVVVVGSAGIFLLNQRSMVPDYNPQFTATATGTLDLAKLDMRVGMLQVISTQGKGGIWISTYPSNSTVMKYTVQLLYNSQPSAPPGSSALLLPANLTAATTNNSSNFTVNTRNDTADPTVPRPTPGSWVLFPLGELHDAIPGAPTMSNQTGVTVMDTNMTMSAVPPAGSTPQPNQSGKWGGSSTMGDANGGPESLPALTIVKLSIPTSLLASGVLSLSIDAPGLQVALGGDASYVWRAVTIARCARLSLGDDLKMEIRESLTARVVGSDPRALTVNPKFDLNKWIGRTFEGKKATNVLLLRGLTLKPRSSLRLSTDVGNMTIALTPPPSPAPFAASFRGSANALIRLAVPTNSSAWWTADEAAKGKVWNMGKLEADGRKGLLIGSDGMAAQGANITKMLRHFDFLGAATFRVVGP
ncbi:hypothetical protein BC828DRAFT_73367 [Blastocladiella britannica]|nr:hypothetical protein BC828DRAFT_73367 [Blastocladiella britannica]